MTSPETTFKTVLLIDDEWCSHEDMQNLFAQEFLINEINESDLRVHIEMLYCSGQNAEGQNEWDIVASIIKENKDKIDLILLDVDFKEDGVSCFKGKEYYENIKACYPELAKKTKYFTDQKIDKLGLRNDIATFTKRHFVKGKPNSVSNQNNIMVLSGDTLKKRLFELLEIVRLPQNTWFASPKMKVVQNQVTKFASTLEPVLIRGESGTGKEIIARMIHLNTFGDDKKKPPFVAVNCAAIPDNLIESELFGHEKGAFTGANQQRQGKFEEAIGGTLFLDEVGDLPLSLQSKLLRAIQEKVINRVGGNADIEVNCRILTATHQNLEGLITDKLFRRDLFFRINVLEITIPPLRERVEDIKLLLLNKFENLKIDLFKPNLRLSEGAKNILIGYNYPGNIRELENILKRLVVLKSDSGVIDAEDVREIIGSLGNYSYEGKEASSPESSGFSESERKKELTLEQLINDIKSYKPKINEIEGKYDVIRDAVQRLFLDCLVEIESHGNRKGQLNDVFANEGSYPQQNSFVRRICTLGFNAGKSAKLHEQSILKELKDNPKYSKFYIEDKYQSSQTGGKKEKS